MDDENEDLKERIKQGALKLFGQTSAPVGMGDVREAESGVERISNPENIPQESLLASAGLNRPVNVEDILRQRKMDQQAMEMGMGTGTVGKLQPAIQEIEGGFKYAPVIKKTAQSVGDAVDTFNKSFSNPEIRQAAIEKLRQLYNR